MAVKPRILVVDDEEDVLILLQKCFDIQGWDVIVASDGNDCIVKARENHPDLIVLDVVTPVKHALKFCQELRTDDRYRLYCNIPILLTYYPLEPFDPVQLLEQVEHSIEVAQMPKSDRLSYSRKSEAAIYVKENIHKGHRVPV